jgi:membrane protein DedA with SNARE-associated domain
MFRVRILSRTGNRVLALAGAMYAVAGVVLLGWFLIDSWGAASLVDRAMQVLLLGTIVMGVWFIYVARVNLTSDLTSHPRAQQHRTSAEATT